MLPYFTRLRLAFRSFFGVLDYARVPDEVIEALGTQPVRESAAGAPAGLRPAQGGTTERVRPTPETPDTGDRVPSAPPAPHAADSPRVQPARLTTAAPPQAPAVEEGARAAQILAILQRDGRLIDFLMEEIAAFPDAQIGAAVRDVHAGSRQALLRYIALSPVLDGEEGNPVTVPAGTDAAAVKVIGNVAGAPPYRGLLRHRGWRASRLDLPPLPATDHLVIAPAEVEIP
jgi:hypothetical protein